MSMKNQIHMYSVDTSFFYYPDEMIIHDNLNLLYLERKPLKESLEKLKIKLHNLNSKQNNYSEEDTLKLNNYKINIEKLNSELKIINKKIKDLKDDLYESLENNKGAIRNLNEDKLSDKLIISSFESTLTRTIGIKNDTLTKDIMIVQTYFFDILEDLIKNGFYWENNKYKCFTASAGQIRTKKTVFIKESVWKKYESTLMCGLTFETINNKYGGMNINKFLAYLALNNSATDLWENFDIDKSIVVEDFESKIKCEVDFIDDKQYSIERAIKDIEINHTDGSGMILPKVSKKSFMTRLPFVKGLLISFPFDKFIRVHNRENKDNIGKIHDIYGKEYDILEDEIEIIFTKSQFKMWKYYSEEVEVEKGLMLKGWDLYRYYFKKYNCQAGITNMEPDEFTKASLNYQMLQTLTNISYEEIQYLLSNTQNKISKISSDRDTMLRVIGVTKSNYNKNYYQKSLEIYPELLSDTYSKELLKGLKRKLVKNAKHGKIDIESSYTFICPDMYAFCEYLFKGENNPKGLLANGEIYCSLYSKSDKLDCLRSPHLYREHAVRNNVIDNEKKKWFTTKGLYISVHDPISRILQCDFDGDKALVVADELFISIAERNMKDIVPLYYEMAVASKQFLNSENIYEGLKLAYTGGNIGIISNEISKIWNSEDLNLDVIKLLCMENNFVIDYAKTLYKPNRPKNIDEIIKYYTKKKVPNFFIHAKEKKENQVEQINDSTVNTLQKLVKNPIMNFKKAKLGNFDYTMLMSENEININENLINKYKELDLTKRFIISEEVSSLNSDSELYVYKKIRDELLNIEPNISNLVNSLVKYLYVEKNSSYKSTLWSCFGKELFENLQINMDNRFKNSIQCHNCGERIIKTNNKIKYCKPCSIKIDNNNRKNRK